MRVIDLLHSPDPVRQMPPPEMDPLRLNGVLDESLLVSVLVPPLGNRVMLLFDVRLAMQLRGDNAAVVVAAGLKSASIKLNPSGNLGRTAPVVLGWTANRGSTEVAFGTENGWDVAVEAVEAWFCSGTVPDLAPSQPDLVAERLESVEAQLPSIGSVLMPRAYSYHHEGMTRP